MPKKPPDDLDERIDERLIKIFLTYSWKVIKICFLIVTAIITGFYGLGVWLYNHSSALSAALKAFIKTNSGM